MWKGEVGVGDGVGGTGVGESGAGVGGTGVGESYSWGEPPFTQYSPMGSSDCDSPQQMKTAPKTLVQYVSLLVME